MRNFTLLIVLLGFSAIRLSSAQSAPQDVLYLRDGSIFKGVIVEQYPDSLIKIKIVGGNIISVLQEDLDHAEYKVKSKADVTEQYDLKTIQRKETGYFNITEIGILPGTSYGYYYYSSGGPTGFTIQNINGYRFNPNFLVGGGIGIDIIDLPMLQVFGDARWEFLKTRATPFIYLDAGYGMTLAKDYADDYQELDYSGGFTWGTGAGMRFNFRQEGAVLISAGYKMNKRTEKSQSDYWPYYTNSEYTYNRLCIKFGFAF